jgi:hypothetical protein
MPPRTQPYQESQAAKKSVRGSIKKASWDNSFLEAILVGN